MADLQVNGQTNVRKWYKEAYPTDEWAFQNLNPGITFQDVYVCLLMKADIYAFLGAGDSIVRERVFTELAELMGVDYSVVYNQWMQSENPLGLKLYHDMSKLTF